MNRSTHLRMFAAAALFVAALAFAILAPRSTARAAQPSGPSRIVVATAPSPMPSPEELLAAIRRQFRSHRPPPPYEFYTLVREQKTSYGAPDYLESYTWHIWYRSVDHAALGRKESRLGAHGQLTFKRPMFNVADDPGPPTADVFEPAPAHTPAADFVPTPEASAPPVITTVRVRGEFDYRVVSIERTQNELHLTVTPRRDPDRNRLRELFVDANTLELHKIIATDKLFVEHGPIYPVTFTIYFSTLQSVPVITNIHGVVGGGYDEDGQIVDFYFKDLRFPATLPAWYFDPHSYASHVDDAPL